MLTGSADSVKNLFYDVTYMEPEWSEGTELATIAKNSIELGSLGKLGADGKLYKALPDNASYDVTPRVANNRWYVFDKPVPKKHTLQIKANGVELEADKVVPGADFWAGQRLDFEPWWSPTPTEVASKLVRWKFGGKFVNQSWQHSIGIGGDPPSIQYYGSVNYLMNPDLLNDETTHGWWLSNNDKPLETLKAKIVEQLTFSNGQKATVIANGKFNMNSPEFFHREMCQDRDPDSQININDPCLFVVQDASYVNLGNQDGGYARFWAGFFARPGDKFYETQIVKSYRQWGNNAPDDSGSEWWHDGTFTTKYGGISPADAAGLAIVQQTDKYPRIPKDAPGLHLNDTFKTYFQFQPKEDGSILVTLGRVDWSWAVEGLVVNGQWIITPGTISAPAWKPDDSFPEWTGETP